MGITINRIFMVPTLKLPGMHDNNHGFINAYHKDLRRDVQYEDAVYLLFRPVDIDRFREFLESEYERTDSVIEDYDYEDGYVVVVYKLNPYYKPDFDLIREGKYSKTSKEFQELFPKKVRVKDDDGFITHEDALAIRIFERREELKEYWEEITETCIPEDMEVWDEYNDEKESMDLDKIIIEQNKKTLTTK